MGDALQAVRAVGRRWKSPLACCGPLRLGPCALASMAASPAQPCCAALCCAVQTLNGALPIGAAVVADAVAHSIPGLNVLLNLITEPLGAACGVAYMM